MKILLLGGTGAMGIHLADLLSKQGNEIFVTTRKKRMDMERITYLQGDAHDTEFLCKVLSSEWDAIVDFMVYNTVEFANGVGLLLSSTYQYIFLSSARVFAETEGFTTEKSARLLDISTDVKYLKTDEYALTKARQEDILRRSGRTNWTIVRPYITFSEIRLQLGVYEKENWLYQALHGRPIVFSKDIARHYTTLTHGFDVARGIVGLIGNLKAAGEDFNIVTNEAYTWQKILELYLDVLEKHIGSRPNVKYTEAAINLQFERLQYQVKYCRLFDRCFDNTKLLSVVPNLQFSNTLQELQNSLNVFLENPCFIPLGWGMQGLMDRVTGERVLMSEIPSYKQCLKYMFAQYIPLRVMKYISF